MFYKDNNSAKLLNMEDVLPNRKGQDLKYFFCSALRTDSIAQITCRETW